MRASVLLVIFSALTIQGLRIVMGNDDGWAEHIVRIFYKTLSDLGHDVVLSAPAENKSGRGSKDKKPWYRIGRCHYGSCFRRSGYSGYNESDPKLNWVNSYPVTAMRYGIGMFGPEQWNGSLPEFAVSGINVGDNLYWKVPYSGTVGAAVEAVQHGIPAIAFSGDDNTNAAWNAPAPKSATVYSWLAAKVLHTVIAGGPPYLPRDTWLNVNFPELSKKCQEPEDFKFVLARTTPRRSQTRHDFKTCNDTIMPYDSDVVHTRKGCWASITVCQAEDKKSARTKEHEFVHEKLKDILSCFHNYDTTPEIIRDGFQDMGDWISDWVKGDDTQGSKYDHWVAPAYYIPGG